MSEFHRLAMTIAFYKQEHDSWPTQVRLGPNQISQILDEYGPDGLQRISDHMDLRVISDWDISVGGRSVIHYEDFTAFKDKAGDPKAEVYRWLGFKYPRGN